MPNKNVTNMSISIYNLNYHKLHGALQSLLRSTISQVLRANKNVISFNEEQDAHCMLRNALEPCQSCTLVAGEIEHRQYSADVEFCESGRWETCVHVNNSGSWLFCVTTMYKSKTNDAISDENRNYWAVLTTFLSQVVPVTFYTVASILKMTDCFRLKS